MVIDLEEDLDSLIDDVYCNFSFMAIISSTHKCIEKRLSDSSLSAEMKDYLNDYKKALLSILVKDIQKQLAATANDPNLTIVSHHSHEYRQQCLENPLQRIIIKEEDMEEKRLKKICSELWDMWGDKDNPNCISNVEKADIVIKIDKIADDENLKALQAELKGAVVFSGWV
ncbi:hypothetical protein LCGC14_0932820 [marine sediment metagenome]|uniref:Uncharacterized protein n=1 Tax=marine sediment metagenome TaxID=412755 RepID=A0A0F9NMI7_9ZZZZ